mmetsp:Transcript_5461/g.6390  ORF Transcript_5461/g.6390 Transcript_5461/m.6390 type:complete len:99 (+) Transcript_5461:272-568(+)
METASTAVMQAVAISAYVSELITLRRIFAYNEDSVVQWSGCRWWFCSINGFVAEEEEIVCLDPCLWFGYIGCAAVRVNHHLACTVTHEGNWVGYGVIE